MDRQPQDAMVAPPIGGFSGSQELVASDPQVPPVTDAVSPPATASTDDRAASRFHIAGRGWPALLRWVGGLVAVVMVGLAWAVSSPAMSSPDEDFHLASIWCAWGRDASSCQVLATPADGSALVVRIPALNPYVSDCMAVKPDQSAACVYPTRQEPVAPDYPARANGGGYPRLFYGFLRLFLLGSVPPSLIAMRLAVFLTSVGIIAAATGLLPKGDARRIRAFVAVASIPLGIFIFASINPSAWTMAGTVALFCAVLGLARARTPRRAGLAIAVATLAALMACGARPDASIFVGLALVAGVLASWSASGGPGRSGLPWRWLGLALPVAVMAVGWVGRAVALSGGHNASPPGWAPLFNALNVASFMLGDFATTLGWNDTHMPSVVWGAISLCLGFIAFFGVTQVRRGRGLALLLVGAACVTLPLYLLRSWGALVGNDVQPRYVLPVILLLAAVLAWRGSPEEGRIPRGQAGLLAVLAIGAQTVALHTQLLRYIAGQDVHVVWLDDVVEWWWNVPVGPAAVWLVGSIAFGVLLVVTLFEPGPRRDRPVSG